MAVGMHMGISMLMIAVFMFFTGFRFFYFNKLNKRADKTILPESA